MKIWIDTTTGIPVKVGDIIKMDFRRTGTKRINVRVRNLQPEYDGFAVSLVDEEGADHAGLPYDWERQYTNWCWGHLTSVRYKEVPEGYTHEGLVLCDNDWVLVEDTVIDYLGIRIARSNATELTIEGKTKYAMTTETIEIDGETYLKSRCHRVVHQYSERRSGGEWVAEEPDTDDYIFMDDYDCWAHADLLDYCYGGDRYCWEEDGEMWDGEWYSHDWLSDHTFVCDDCGERYHNDDYAQDGVCNNCYHPSGLQSYSDKSSAKFRPEKNVPLKFGIELEVESRDANAGVELCESIFPDQYVVYKEDGSLSDEGFEIVTRPDAPEVHKRIFSKFLGDPRVRRTLTSWNSGSCGVHIHVSRAPLSALWIGRIIVMINSPAMKSIVGKVSGRYNTSYAGINNSKGLTHGKKNKNERKYDAVNNSPRDTIEFRLFRGTLVKESFLRYIEFVESVLAFTSPATTSNRDVSEPQKYLDFVSKRRKDYKILFEFLRLKGFPVTGPVIKPKPEHIK